MPGWLNRSTVTFVVNETLGVGILLHELLVQEAERPLWLALGGGLIGFPFVLAADQRIAGRQSEDDDEERWSHLP